MHEGKGDLRTCYELFGIECGKGWEKLYGPLKKELEEAGGTITQIKEKFGGLRFYYFGPPITENWTDEKDIEFADRVSKAEADSFKTCEACGAPGEVRPGGWISTLCDEHAKKEDNETTDVQGE